MSYPSDSLYSAIDSIKNFSGDSYWCNDKNWTQFVKDHRSELIASSTIMALDPNKANKASYSIEMYLKELSLPESIGWIVIWLNQLDSSMNFDGTIETLMVPSISTIATLKKSYTNMTAMQIQRLGRTDL